MNIEIDLSDYSFSEWELRDLCRSNGFEIVEIENLKGLTLIEKSNLDKFIEIFRRIDQIELENFLNSQS